jgi:hypothetical protein
MPNQIEINSRVAANREATYLYIEARKDVVGLVCVEQLKFYAKGKKYLEWLTAQGHLTRVKKVSNGRRVYVYNAAIPYVKPIQKNYTDKPTSNEDIIKSVTRVFKLLDRPQTLTTKEERAKARTKSKSVAIGSSMQLFGGW